MREIRTLIVDDEPLARRGVRQLLNAFPDFVVVGECRNGREALKSLEALAPDVVFLDVQMPGLDGFEVLQRRTGGPMPIVVFVTAFDAFAVRAFEAHALDYLVKPIGEDRFARAIERIREQLRLGAAVDLATRLSALLAERRMAEEAPLRATTTLLVHTDSGTLTLSLDELDWIAADDYRAVIHAGAARHRVRESLGALEERLDPKTFVRVHRGAIVRLDRVRELRTRAGGEPVVVLRDGTAIPVSRRRREQVEAMLRAASR